MKVELIASTPGAENLIEIAGRTCYRSESHGDMASFIRRRIKERHLSLLEHASATFHVSGISRACSHQLVRHRLASYAQASQRFIDGSEFGFVTPPSITVKGGAREIYMEALRTIRNAYQQLRELGIRKEDARFLLPNATKTTILVTMNFRSWRHFIKERGLNPRAQWEIQEVALRIRDQLADRFPAVFGDLQ